MHRFVATVITEVQFVSEPPEGESAGPDFVAHYAGHLQAELQAAATRMTLRTTEQVLVRPVVVRHDRMAEA